MNHQLNCKITLLAALLCTLVIPAWAQSPDGNSPASLPPEPVVSPPTAMPVPEVPTASQPAATPVPLAQTDGAGIPSPTPGFNPNAGEQKPGSAFIESGQVGRAAADIDNHSRRTFDRLRRILVLRQLLSLGFTSTDIATALPLLRSLRDLNTAPPADPEKAMDEEYEALLEAEPGQPLPPSSAIKITDAARYVREEQGKIRDQMLRRLGQTKTVGLVNLLGQDSKVLSFQFVDPNRYQKPFRGEGIGPSLRPDGPSVPGTTGSGTVPPPSVDNRFTPSYNITAEDNKGPQLVRQTTNGATEFSKPEQFGQFGKGGGAPNPGAQNGSFQPPSAQFNVTPTTVRVSLAELIDIMQEKLTVMNARRGNSRRR